MGTVTFMPADYYRLKAALLDAELSKERLRQAGAAIEQRLAKAVTDAGLDTSKNYVLDDATLTVREVDTNGTAI